MNIKKITDIHVDVIEVNPDQPRRIFGEDELMELMESIKEYGVIQPVIVKKNDHGTYTLIAGERRLRASILAGLEKIPSIVRESDSQDSAIIALVENVQRENLGYMEEAQAYNKLIELYNNRTNNELLLNVYNYMLLLKELVPEYKFAVRHHKKKHVDTDLYAWI